MSSLRLSFKKPSIALLEWNQPGSSVNLLSSASLKEWEEALSELEQKNPKSIILISKKTSGFCAGADLREIQSLARAGFSKPEKEAKQDHQKKSERERRREEIHQESSRELQREKSHPESGQEPQQERGQLAGLEQDFKGKSDLRQILERVHSLFLRWESLQTSKIAAIEGLCLGGGLELALAFDYRLAGDSPRLKIGLPEVRLGLIPGAGGCLRLPRLAGLKAGLSMILAGKTLSGKEALKKQLIDELIPPPILLPKALELAREIAEGKRPPHPPQKYKPKGWLALLEERLGKTALFYLAKKKTLKKSLCPAYLKAPLKALETVKKIYGSPSTAQALKAEAEAFCSLARAKESQNFIRLFFLKEKAEKQKTSPSEKISPALLPNKTAAAALSAPPKRAGVLGAGVMGGGIAYLLGDRGWIVRLKDTQPEALSKALRSANSLWKAQIQRGRLTKREGRRRAERLSPALDYSGFSALDFVLEAVTEDIDLKKKIIGEVSKLMRPEAVLASNTSSLLISELAEACAHPERFAGIHFFNPVHRMPLAEIIRGRQTADSALAAATQIAKALGKTPVLVRDSPGFAVNRLLAPYLAEALWLLEEGNGVERVDRLYEREFGLPMGPFRLMDEAGLDVCAKVISRFQRFNFSRFKFPHFDSSRFKLSMETPMAAEKLPEILGSGRKAGKGFYIYEGNSARANPEALQFQKRNKASDSKTLIDRGIYRLINEGMKALKEGVVESADDLDLAMVLGMGFPPFLGGPMRLAQSLGWEKIRARLKGWAETEGPRFAPYENT